MSRAQQKKSGTLYGTVVFCIIGVCLQLLYLLIYPTGDTCRWLEYALVLVCLAYSLYAHSLDVEGCLCVTALGFTAAADFFLVALREAQLLPGVAMFCVAQLFWAGRLMYLEEGKRRLSHLVAWACTAGTLAIVAIVVARKADPLLLLCAGYFSFLLTTALFAWLTPKNLLFALGMTLFVGCDLFVIAGNAGTYVDISTMPLLQSMNAIHFNMAWLFYGPSQMLLALSARGGLDLEPIA